MPPMHPHAARAQIVPAALGRDGQRLHGFDVVRRAGNMNLAGGDRSRRSSVKVVLQETHRGQTRRVIAKGDMHMRVDEARDRP